jgi:hypothetical protein
MFYKPPPPHSALGGISPDEYENRFFNRQKEARTDTLETPKAA